MLNKIVLNVSKEIEIIGKIIFDEFSENTLIVSPIIDKGFVNRVYRAETEKFQFIVRINDANSFDEYKKEVWASEQAILKEIQTPKILKVGIFGNKTFTIQKFINGIEGRDFPGNKKFIWKKLGEYAQRIHKISVKGFGLSFRNMTQDDSKIEWLRYLNYNIESLNDEDELLKLNVLTKRQSQQARKIFEILKAREFNFGLNHGDLSLKNTIVDDAGIVHLLDWGSSEASIVPHHDLIQLLKVNMQQNDPDNSEIQAFLEGCEIDKSQFQEMLPDLEALMLLRSFDKLRWAIDWKIEELNNYIFDVNKTVERVIS